MSTEGLLPDFPVLSYSEGYTGMTVRGSHTITRATAANIVALGRPCRQFGGMNAQTPDTFAFSYTRSHADINQLRIAWAYHSDPALGAVTATASLTLTITDALGNSVAASDARIPTAFDGTAVYVMSASLSDAGDIHLGGIGYLDTDALATTLTDPSWSFEFVFARSAGDATLEWVDAWECPRSVVSSADTYGTLTGPMNPGNPITAGTVATRGYERLAKTIEGGILANRVYLSVAWPANTGASIPSVVGAAYGPFATMTEAAGVALPWRIRPRVVYLPNDAAGEPGRVRFLYYQTGGFLGSIRTDTGSTGPFDVTGITGASWQWSAWTNVLLPTNGTDRIVSVTFKGKTTGGTLYIAGIQLEESQ